jgi:hypothetical protein
VDSIWILFQEEKRETIKKIKIIFDNNYILQKKNLNKKEKKAENDMARERPQLVGLYLNI